MLSRDARNLYWMSRYIERAGHCCRLLENQLEAIHDRPADDIERGWRRTFDALRRRPAGADIMPSDGDTFVMLFDAYTLTDDLTFERSNPNAITHCFAKARENARQIRNNISQDMWSSLNVACLEMRGARLRDFWNTRPGEFFEKASASVRTFRGIAEATMYRDHGWHFLQLGQYLERAVLVTDLVDAHIGVFSISDRHWNRDWGSLLTVCAARSAFRRLHSIEYLPQLVTDFLVADARLANSVSHAIRAIEIALAAVSDRQPGKNRQNAERLIGKVRSLVEFDWPVRDAEDDASSRAILREITALCLQLHDSIENSYFGYPPTEVSMP